MAIKNLAKKILTSIGLVHSSMGIKISPEQKAAILLGSKTQDIKIFVETGTHEGWMIDKIGSRFEQIYSIELDDRLFDLANKRFQDRPNVHLLHGDSAILIKKVLDGLHDRALFWLDAHASGAITAVNAPVVKELEAIFAHEVKEHLIFIDDARHFDRETIREIKKITEAHKYIFKIQNGLFELLPINAN